MGPGDRNWIALDPTVGCGTSVETKVTMGRTCVGTDEREAVCVGSSVGVELVSGVGETISGVDVLASMVEEPVAVVGTDNTAVVSEGDSGVIEAGIHATSDNKARKIVDLRTGM
jgi:hypothetical protein